MLRPKKIEPYAFSPTVPQSNFKLYLVLRTSGNMGTVPDVSCDCYENGERLLRYTRNDVFGAALAVTIFIAMTELQSNRFFVILTGKLQKLS
jgi:hypothetical protein